MRVLFAIKVLHDAAGGAERVLATVASGLADQGHEVTVVSFDMPGNPSFYPFDSRVKLQRLGRVQTQGTTGLRDVISRAIALRRYAAEWGPDVAIGFLNSAYVPLGLGLIGTRVPVIASEHISYVHYADRPVERILLALSPLISDRMTVPSAMVRQGFPPRLRRRIVAIPNPVAQPTPSRSTMPSSRPGSTTVLSIGRLAPQKDFATAIAAFGSVAAKFPDWRLRIVGDGPLREVLTAQVGETGLADRVDFPGVISEISAEYHKAAIFLMSSRYESFGLVTAEAMAHGLPAIGFADCPGTNELIQPQINGILVDGEDRVASLAAGLCQLMADPGLRQRLGAAAPATVSHFSSEAVIAAWDELIGLVTRPLRPFSSRRRSKTAPPR